MEKSRSNPYSFFAESISMVTAKDGDRENAMPASWCVPVSFSPPMVAVNISSERYTHKLIKKSGMFGLCLLAEDQSGLASFAGSCSGNDTDKFKKLPHFYGELGLPLIEGSVACMECKIVDAPSEGDHTVFVGKVVSLYATDKKPLIAYKGEYFKMGGSLGDY